MQRFFLMVLSLVLFLAACMKDGELKPLEPGKTPENISATQPQLVTFRELQANPQAYQDQLIRVTGTFLWLPPPDCIPFSGPQAQWALVAEDLRLDAIGFEALMNLVPDGTLLTVDGFFRFYDGPVGCGKEPPVDTVWFLDVVKIVQPNPLSRIFGTPRATFDGSQLPPVDGSPTATLSGTLEGTPDPTQEIGTPGGTTIPTGTPTGTIVGPVTPSPTPAATSLTPGVPTATPSPRPTDGLTAVPTQTIAPTSTPGPGTPTATPPNANTPTPPGTLAATPTTPGGYPGPSTPTQTSEPPSYP